MARRSMEENTLAQELISHYEENRAAFQTVLKGLYDQITTSPKLTPYIHSLKWRTKSIPSLEDQILRKMDEAKAADKPFGLTKQNLFVKINDLAGFRILHLNTDQLPNLAAGLKDLLKSSSIPSLRRPLQGLDDESRELLRGMGFKIVNKPSKPSFYTSVHYVIKANRKTKITCEIQVRTLMEEVWGEVDHLLNYPHKTKILACKEQIAALARATSTCSRLVDSIFRSHADLSRPVPKPSRKSP